MDSRVRSEVKATGLNPCKDLTNLCIFQPDLLFVKSLDWKDRRSGWKKGQMPPKNA
jgi:hypothetical protein